MSFEEAVNSLISRCAGAKGAAIVDPDGIPVAICSVEGDLEPLGAELATVLRVVDQAGREFHHGALQQFTVHLESAVIVLTTISAGYFLLLVLGRDGVAGKGRFVSRLMGSRLLPEFI